MLKKYHYYSRFTNMTSVTSILKPALILYVLLPGFVSGIVMGVSAIKSMAFMMVCICATVLGILGTDRTSGSRVLPVSENFVLSKMLLVRPLSMTALFIVLGPFFAMLYSGAVDSTPREELLHLFDPGWLYALVLMFLLGLGVWLLAGMSSFHRRMGKRLLLTALSLAYFLAFMLLLTWLLHRAGFTEDNYRLRQLPDMLPGCGWLLPGLAAIDAVFGVIAWRHCRRQYRGNIDEQKKVGMPQPVEFSEPVADRKKTVPILIVFAAVMVIVLILALCRLNA